jgi:hypothetical protein
MKKIVEIDANEGLPSLLGEQVLLMCANYFYAGKLTGINKTCVRLDEAKIVYDTGAWDKTAWDDAQPLGAGPHYVRLGAIESFRKGK